MLIPNQDQKTVYEITLADQEVNCTLVLTDSVQGQEGLRYIQESIPFFKNVEKRDRTDKDEDYGIIYLPNYQDYMDTISTWLNLDIDTGDDITEDVTQDTNCNTTHAYRVVLSALMGSDMMITIYIPQGNGNDEEVEHFQASLWEHESQISVDIVSKTFALEHPMNFLVTGIADVEQCMYIDSIQVPRRKRKQTVKEWLGGDPKHLDWKAFLTRDLDTKSSENAGSY